MKESIARRQKRQPIPKRFSGDGSAPPRFLVAVNFALKAACHGNPPDLLRFGSSSQKVLRYFLGALFFRSPPLARGQPLAARAAVWRRLLLFPKSSTILFGSPVFSLAAVSPRAAVGYPRGSLAAAPPLPKKFYDTFWEPCFMRAAFTPSVSAHAQIGVR